MDRGLYASLDRGASWVDLRLNLPRVSVRGIKIEPRYNDLVIGTHGVGAWILDDIQPLVELTSAMGEPIHLFDIREATDWSSWNRDSNLGRSTFLGQNPREGAYIDFWLSEEVAGSQGVDATIRITDVRGWTIREMRGVEGVAGVNRAVWNLTMDGPDPIPGEGGGGGGRFGPSGPPVAPGTYTATLTVDGQEISKQFQVRGDPEVNISQADYEARTEAAVRGRELQSRLNGMIGALVSMRAQARNLVDALGASDVGNRQAIVDQAQTTIDAIDALENELRRPPPRRTFR